MRELILALAVVVGFPVVGLGNWKVSPESYDFGDVEVGASSSCEFTITNLDPNNSMTNAPPYNYTVPAGASVNIEVTFHPTCIELSSAYLQVYVPDGDPVTSYLPLTGNGVDSEPPPEQVIQDILDFVDASVAAGKLSGSGPGNSANGRLNALINMVESAGDLMEDGDYETAYDQLETVYEKCDGETPPPDFVEGEAREELAGMISDLMAVLLLLMM
jgi:hypothetical protein